MVITCRSCAVRQVSMTRYSCHTVSQQEIDAGTTYLGLMWQNVDALKEALN